MIDLWKHQKEAVERARDQSNFALLFTMGTGKTATAIHILRQWYAKGMGIGKTLILAPPIVVRNWGDEWALHSKVKPQKICLLHGAGKDRIRRFISQVLEGDARIAITNYEGLLIKGLFEKLREWKPEYIIFDESHYLKSQKARRSRLACELANPEKTPAPKKLILTGTPVLNSPMDLFMQFLILDGGATFGKNFFVFRATYFQDKNAGMPKNRYFPNWQIKKGALEAIQKKIGPKSMHVKLEDCMDLPPLIRQKIYVGMTPDQRRMYEEMKKDFVTYMKNDKAVVATMALTKALRLMQIASGYTKDVGGEEVEIEDTPKLKALSELLTEITLQHKVLLWLVFKSNIRSAARLCKKLGISYVECHGDISDNGKHEAVSRFNEDPNVRVFIGHPGSGGIGINLVSAPYSIFYSRNFSLGQDVQAQARNYRAGSERHEKIIRIDLVTEDTIEDIILDILLAKQTVSDKVLKDLSKKLGGELR